MKPILLQQKSGEDLLQTRAEQEQPLFGRKKRLMKQPSVGAPQQAVTVAAFETN